MAGDIGPIGPVGVDQRGNRWTIELVETMGTRVFDLRRLPRLKEAARDRVGWRDVVRVVTRGRLRSDGTMFYIIFCLLSS